MMLVFYALTGEMYCNDYSCLSNIFLYISDRFQSNVMILVKMRFSVYISIMITIIIIITRTLVAIGWQLEIVELCPMFDYLQQE